MKEVLQDDQFIRELTIAQNSLYAFILTLLPDTNQASDVLQETNIQLCRKADTFARGTNFLAWACTVARYKVLEHRRHLGRDQLVFGDDLLDRLASEAQGNPGHYAEELTALNECLSKLPDPQRELISSRYAPGGSVEGIARNRSRSASSVSVTLFRIRRALLDCIQRKLARRGAP